MADTQFHFELYDGRALYDGDYPPKAWFIIDGQPERVRCKAFTLWSIMLRKAYGPRAGAGLTVCEPWRRSFMAFRSWLVEHSQWERRRLVLRRGDREFNPETTILLPAPPAWNQPPAVWSRTAYNDLTACGSVPLGHE